MENWKDIPGYNGYYKVSDLGRVKSIEREITYVVNGDKRRKTIKERILKQLPNGEGYLRVRLYQNGTSSEKSVSVLVAKVFLSHEPDRYKKVVDHINNDRTDNRLSNLQIISHRENCSKDKKNGTSKYTGVTWNKHYQKWMSSIYINGKSKTLGYFESEEQASIEYQLAKRDL